MNFGTLGTGFGGMGRGGAGVVDTLTQLFAAGNAGAWFKTAGLSAPAWIDASGYHHDIGQVTAGKQPTISGSDAVFDGTDDMFTASHAASVSLVSATTLPDGASGSVAGRGFTGTGWCKDSSDGTYWVSNHGKAKASDPSFVSSIVHLDTDFSLIEEFELDADLGITGAESVQGICENTATGAIAFYHLGDETIYEMAKDGSSCTAQSTIGAITGGNGLTYDSILDHYVLGVSSSCRWYNRSTGALTQSRTPLKADGTSVAPDQLHFDATRNWLWYSYDGTPGFVGAVDLSFNFAPHVVTLTLEDFDAAEGLIVDGNSILTLNDRYFHGGSTPTDLNQILIYSYIVPRYLNLGTRFQMAFIYRLPNTPGSTKCLLAFGDPQTATSEGGYGFYTPSGGVTTFRSFHRNSSRDLTVTSLATRCVIFLDVDLTNNAFTLWQNTTKIADSTFPSANTPATIAKRLVLGARPSVAAGTVFVNAEIRELFWMEGTAALDNRAAITAEMMARSG